MSIAVSAVVRPSRLLFGMACVMCCAVVAAAGLVAAGSVGDLAPSARYGTAAACLAGAIFGFCRSVKGRKAFHIDISGNGQIRLTEDYALAGFSRETDRSSGKSAAKEVRLMADSTIWPGLLLLRLRAEDRRVTTVPILPDCLTPDGFKALSVACRWIAAHNDPKQG